MESLRNREEMPKETCWDLTKIIKDEKEIPKLIERVKKNSQKIVDQKGHLLDSVASLKEFLQISEQEERDFSKLLIYSKFLFDQDTTNSKNKKLYLQIEALSNEICENESFACSELMEHNLEDILELIKDDEELKKYELYFIRFYRRKERILSEKEEAIITKAKNAFGTPDDAFTALDNADVRFDKVKVDENEIELTQYNYNEFLENKNQNVRCDAFKALYKFYEQHKNTFSSLLKGNYQELEFIRNIRKYPSALEMALDGTEIDRKVYDNLISAVHKYMDINVEYQKLKAKMLGTEEYHLYDTYVPVVEKEDHNYTVEEAIEVVEQAIKPLGEEYLKHFQTIFDDRTVDIYPNKGKHSGAYQWGCFDSPSYVLLNFNGTFDSVSTLAHELGHAVHTMYANESNPYIYANYEIFLAEIASTVNETLLSNYMIENATTKAEKMYYLCEFLDKVKATIYRQTMFAEFEYLMSEKMQNKESLTEEEFSNTYYELNQTYFKDSVIVDNEIRYEWMRIPHFYTPFYVYQYATGLLSAICIVKKIMENVSVYREKYIEFLKGGSSDKALEILKKVDVDLTKEETYEEAFNFIKEKLDELKKLVNEGEANE